LAKARRIFCLVLNYNRYGGIERHLACQSPMKKPLCFVLVRGVSGVVMSSWGLGLSRYRHACTGHTQLKLIFEGGANALPCFWQRRFYDFAGAGPTLTLNASSEARSLPEKRVQSEKRRLRSFITRRAAFALEATQTSGNAAGGNLVYFNSGSRRVRDRGTLITIQCPSGLRSESQFPRCP
jgi:hypothetical protein